MLGMLGDTRLEFASMTEAQLKEEVQTGLKLQDEYDRLLDQLVACYKRIVEGACSMGRERFVAEVGGEMIQIITTDSTHQAVESGRRREASSANIN